MPELPDVTIYVDALRQRIIGDRIARVRIVSPFILRTFDPPIEAVEGKRIAGVSRIGKRIVLEAEDELFLVIHLMIAGRLRWIDGPGAKAPGGKITLASLEFPSGTLAITEASTKKRASLHVVAGRQGLGQFQRGGIDVLEADLASFGAALARERHTLKRALTDPRLFDGIGNAYSDEILHAARLSPFKITTTLDAGETARLHDATRGTLCRWIARLREEFDDGAGGLRFPGPGEITAFRPDFAVHGRFGEPCPVCATKVQRVVYSEREFNYCPTCQTEGRILADRSLSRLLRDEFPRTVRELEALEE
ncbi:MAG TPA: DNA-formamidopyrimidine glycosylase family protein [Phycisphaerales bacterium]|nr:DNA-formamidopyrimidine glycosylase family protein [Phycisphaerales bacterium]